MREYWFLFLAPLLHFLASLSFPFVYWPEMLNWPLILSAGWLPYKDFTTIHTPLLPYILTLFYSIFGFEILSLRLFAAGMLALTSFLLGFLIFTTTKNKWLTVVSAFVYIYLTFAFEGNTVWFESALAPIFLLSFILMKKTLEEAESKNFFYLGGLLAVALLIKQTSLYLLPVYALFFLYLFFRRKLTLQRVTLFIAPAASLLLLFAFYLHSLDLWPHFYRWAVEFVFLLPSLSTADVPPDLLLPSKKQLLLILLIVFVGIYALWQTRKFATLLVFSFVNCLAIFHHFNFRTSSQEQKYHEFCPRFDLYWSNHPRFSRHCCKRQSIFKPGGSGSCLLS